ncbi:MAG TPA: hypothetical protein VFB25_02315 [Gaiellaceae bacterium]|nr:hypothetical protein [Gaiellaceae bacterium]
MKLVPASPRARRRLVWVAVPVVVAAIAGTVIAVLPSKSPPKSKNVAAPTPTVQQLAGAPAQRLTAADRRAIDATLDAFIPAGVARKNLAAAWALAGPELRSAQTHAQWLAGTTPIPQYPAAGTTFHDWQTIDSGPRYVIFNILIHPTAGAQVAPYEFSGEMIKRDGKWLVNRLYTIAIFNRVTKTTHEIGPADFAAPPPSSTPHARAVLGGFGLLPIVALLGLVLLVPAGFGAIALVRARRWRRQSRASRGSELPPLPASYLRQHPEQSESLSPH